jgi:hypothetical protein
MGRSLGGEDIAQRRKKSYWGSINATRICYSRGICTHEWIIETPDVRKQGSSGNFTTDDDPATNSWRENLMQCGALRTLSYLGGKQRPWPVVEFFVSSKGIKRIIR